MITIYDIKEIEENEEQFKSHWTGDQLRQIQMSSFVFIVAPLKGTYECIKNRQDGTVYVGDMQDFNTDLSDKIMFFTEQKENK